MIGFALYPLECTATRKKKIIKLKYHHMPCFLFFLSSKVFSTILLRKDMKTGN